MRVVEAVVVVVVEDRGGSVFRIGNIFGAASDSRGVGGPLLPRCGPRRCGSGSQSCIPTSRPVRWVWSDTSRRRHGTDAGHRVISRMLSTREIFPNPQPSPCARGVSRLSRGEFIGSPRPLSDRAKRSLSRRCPLRARARSYEVGKPSQRQQKVRDSREIYTALAIQNQREPRALEPAAALGR